MGRVASDYAVSQCEIERHGGALRRLFCDVEKATFGYCFAKYVTPADAGQKHAAPLLGYIDAKSPKMETKIDY